jgi:SAM-dependent methyltransferase
VAQKDPGDGGKVTPLNSTYDASPSDYDLLRDCWLNQRRFLFIAERLAGWGVSSGATVLELGSGTGWLLRRLAARFPSIAFVGLEPNPLYVDFSEARGRDENLRYVEGSVENAVSLLDERFDVILSNDVLHHVESEATAARQAFGVARPGAHWLVIEPNWKNPYVFLGSARRRGERNFWPGPFCEAAQVAGFSVEGRGHLFLIPPLVKRAPGWLKRMETALERVPLIAGGVYLDLTRPFQ